MKKKFIKVASASTLAALAGLSLVACGGGSSTKYTVQLNANDPDTTDSITLPTYKDLTVEKGSTINLPTLTYDGWVFEGWFSDSELTTEFKSTDKVKSNLVLTAKWSKEPVPTYTVTYVTEHGTAPAAVANVTALPQTLPTLSADGYTFGGWYTDEDCSILATAGAAIDRNTTLYAKWSVIVPSAYDVISGKEGNIIATQFNDTTISSYENYVAGNKGFYSANDTQTDTVKVEVKDGAFVVTDTDATESAEGIAEIGFNYEGVIEGTMKYTPVVTDNKAPSKWTLVQFYGYKDVALKASKLFGLRTNGTKDGDTGNIQIVFEGDKNSSDYNYYGTAYQYKVNTELEIYWQYDFSTKKLTVKINDTAIVSDYDVPEANQPVFLTGLGFVTGGQATVRAPKIDDFAVTATPTTLDESKASLKAIVDSKVELMNVDTNYTLNKDQITLFVTNAKNIIDEATSKDEALQALLENLSILNNCLTDADTKSNAKATIAADKADYESNAGYTINKTAFDKVFSDANAAIDAATSLEQIQNIVSGIEEAVAAIKSDATIRTEAINELSEYGQAQYNTLDSSAQTSAYEDYTSVMTTYLGGENGLLVTCSATSIASTLAAGKDAVDDVIDKYQLTLEQYEEKLEADLGSYIASKTNVTEVLTELAKISLDFTSVTTKAEADVVLATAKALADDVNSLYNYIQSEKATLLAFNDDEESFEQTYGASFTALWQIEAGYLIDGYKNLDSAKVDIDQHVSNIRIATEVTVTFKNGDSTFTTATILKNSKVTAPEGTPVNDGYVFAGWDFDFDQTISEATTIYAKWYDTYTTSSQEDKTVTWDLAALSNTLTAGKTVSDGVYENTFTLSGGTNKTKNESGGVGVSFTAATISFTTYSANAVLTLTVYSTHSKRLVALDQNITTQAQQSSNWTNTETVKKMDATITFTISTPGKHFISFDNTEHKLSSIVLSDVVSSVNTVTVTAITADVEANESSFAVSNVKLSPNAGEAFAITDGYTVEVYNSQNQKVDNSNLAAGDYQVVVSYGKYTSKSFNKTIIELITPEYADITYVWNGDKCTATRECTNAPSLTVTETVTGVFTEVTPAGVGVNQTAKYIATFTNELFTAQESDVFEVEDTAIVPEYNAITYVWNEDKCTATKECTNVPSLTVTETVTGVFTEVTAAGIGKEQTAKYVATFTNELFEEQISDTFEVPGTMITVVTTEAELEEAVAINLFGFKLGNDITLTKHIAISASVSINLDNHTIYTGSYRLYAYNESSTIKVSISNGTIEGNASVLRANINSEVTVSDLTVNTTGTGIASTNGTLIINSATINGACAVAAYEGANVEIKNGIFTSTTETIVAQSNSSITINGGDFTSTTACALVAIGGTITIEDAEVNAQEAAVMAFDAGTVVINGGTFTTVDNFVVGTNGTEGRGANTITINGGEFNGNITSSGYVACGIYVANDDTVVVNAGTFNIINGVGVLARSGNTTIDSKVVFNVTGDGTLGKVGDSKVTVPSGEVLVIDYAANYPGGDPTVTNNTSVAAYILVDDEASLATAINTVGSYIVLNNDITLTSNLTIKNNATIDLEKYTIKLDNGSGQQIYCTNENTAITVTFKNGTVVGSKPTISAYKNATVSVDDLTVEAMATALRATEGTLIIESATITAASAVAAYEGANVTIKDGKFTSTTETIVAKSNSTVTIEGGDFTSTTDCALVAIGGTITIEDATVNAQEAAVMAFDAGTVVINGGTFTTVDNFVVGTNGTEGRGANTITINGGTFNGNIKSSGYIACGIYVANDDTVVVNAGTINVLNGVGIVARSGNTTVESAVVFHVTTDGSITSGKVGDANINIEQPHELVLDLLASYPGGTPTLTNNTSYDILRLVGVSTENEFVTAINVANSIVTLKNDITLTGYIITDVNGTVKVIVGDYSIDNSDPVHDEINYTIQIGTNCTLICDVDAETAGIVVAPAGYHIKTTTNTDGTYTFTVEAGE